MKLTIIGAVLLLGILGFLFGVILAFIARKFAVSLDERVAKVLEHLPGINCGACGYPGCSGYAKAVVAGAAPVNGCAPGGKPSAQNIGKIMGQEVSDTKDMVAVAKCSGGANNAKTKYVYKGLFDCRAAYILANGPTDCAYGCIGLGTCVEDCPFGALELSDNCIPITDYDKCTGCGICVRNCPKGVMHLLPRDQLIYIACNSPEKGGVVRKICSTGCICCKICEKECPKDAIEIRDFLAYIDYEKCIQCGICIEKCPTKCILDRGTGIPLPEPARVTRKRLKELKAAQE
ncbi:RnfABCDGE type electron transport complex subunit B [bacterium]|nr:RnfABCDGE type electron transport complex subunit B [bacterium]